MLYIYPMNLEKLQNIESLYFSNTDIARVLSISYKSAQVTASRNVKEKRLIRLKRDFYLLPQKLKTISEDELFVLANILQIPSYVSLTSALSFYNLSTQQMRNHIESIGMQRTISFKVTDIEFNFNKVKKAFYFGFIKKENYFIATPAKALADAIYLTAIGKYNADFDAMDLEKFNKAEINEVLKTTNKAAQNLWQKLTKNYGL